VKIFFHDKIALRKFILGYHTGMKISSLDQLSELAKILAKTLSIGRPLLLSGPMGAGKTALAKRILAELCPGLGVAPSPTFPLILGYTDYQGRPVWHSDLYRLDGPQDTQNIGLTEAMATGLCLIEWPDRLGHFAPQSYTAVHLDFSQKGPGHRQISLFSSCPG
jgi:tRNA threonylcarbamoyladenosine biosynthesis protein TsaE